MSKLSRMQGTPWHIEHMRRKEGDPRRHRANFVHYYKKHNYCLVRNTDCMGSAHCMEYKDAKNCSTKPKNEKSGSIPINFDSTRLIPMVDILSVKDKFNEPSVTELENEKAYYCKHGNFSGNVIVFCYNNKYYVEEGYLYYCVAKLMGKKEINCKVKNVPSFEKETDSVLGKKVHHKFFGYGVVVNVNDNSVIVRFASGRESELDFKMCIVTGLMKFV